MASELPPPRTLTEEDRERVLLEAREWDREFVPKVRALENLTPEDWGSRAK